MPDNNSNQLPSAKQASIRNAIILALFALISTGLIAFTHLLTKDKIAKEVELSMLRQLNEVVAKENYNNSVYQDCILVKAPNFLGLSSAQKIYRMRMLKQDETSNSIARSNYGLLLTTTAPDGYSGRIDIAVAIAAKGNILGVNIFSHQETPGLGDKIERRKSNWLDQFSGLSIIKNEETYWQVKKDGGEFDALTGATITPRAVIKAVYKSLLFYQSNNKLLFDQDSNCGENNE